MLPIRRDAETKTESLRSTVFKTILYGDYQPGTKLPTERDMAHLSGTSRITVRRAFEQLEKAGVLVREQGRGTFVAAHTRGNPSASGYIALLASVDEYFVLEFIRELEKALIARDLLLVLRLTNEIPEREEEAAIDLVSKGISNLVIWPSGQNFPARTFERLRVLGTNMVFFDRMLPGSYADYVGLDNTHAMAQLFACADKRGLRDPVLVNHQALHVDSERLREIAFMTECSIRGLSGKVVGVPYNTPLSCAPEGIGARSAVFCVNDSIALRLKPFVDPLRLYGIDGVPGSGIVSYRQPMVTMAEAVVSHLVSQQNKGCNWRASSHFLRGELVHETGMHSRDP